MGVERLIIDYIVVPLHLSSYIQKNLLVVSHLGSASVCLPG